MPAINKVSPAVFEQPAKRRGRRLSPEMLEMVERIGTIRTERDAFEVLLVGDEKAATVRAQIVRAARIAGVDVAIRRSDLGYYVGLMTPERRGRPRQAG